MHYWKWATEIKDILSASPHYFCVVQLKSVLFCLLLDALGWGIFLLHLVGQASKMDILLVEDNPGDARLAFEAFKEAGITSRLSLVNDGVRAMSYLRREEPYQQVSTPDIVLLDLNMPRKSGREVLADMKADPRLKHIPVIVLSTSEAPTDIAAAYDLSANSYIVKPADFGDFSVVAQSIETNWGKTCSLPPRNIDWPSDAA